MEYISVFDVIGPNMIGPSSSHTAGAARMAFLARKLMHKQVVKVEFILYGSCARTYRGHGTDRALAGGILGFDTGDKRIRDSLELAKQQGMEITFRCNLDETEIHPNTADIKMTDETGHTLTVRGESLGGGKVRLTRINGVTVELTDEYCTLLVFHLDRPGVLAHIADTLNHNHINIAFLRLFRSEKGGETYTVAECDDPIAEEVCRQVAAHPAVLDTILMEREG